MFSIAEPPRRRQPAHLATPAPRILTVQEFAGPRLVTVGEYVALGDRRPKAR
jgi:hypothetical protein